MAMKPLNCSGRDKSWVALTVELIVPEYCTPVHVEKLTVGSVIERGVESCHISSIYIYVTDSLLESTDLKVT